MRVTYIGIGTREVSTEDLQRSAGLDLSSLGMEDGEERTYFWTHMQTNEDVPDVIGEYLIETHRDQFKSGDVINRDLRSKDELYAIAQELKIPNRSKMDRDELAEAIEHELIERANESEGEETPTDLLEELEAEGI
jgi:hypothetical protein